MLGEQRHHVHERGAIGRPVGEREGRGASRRDAAHRAFLAREIGRYLDRAEQQETAKRPEPPAPPPGQPIGTTEPEGLSGCSWEE